MKISQVEINSIKVRPPFSELFSIDERVLRAVKEDMDKRGFDHSQPIVLWDNEGVVIDGHTRLQAARELALEEVPVCVKGFPDEDAAIEYAIHNQRNRRNLTEADILRCIEAVDKRRDRGGDRRSEEARSKASNEAIEKVKSAEETARIVGTSRAKVERARAVLDNPQAAAEVKAGKKKISRAYQEIQAKRKNQNQPEPNKNQEVNRQAILQKALAEIRPWREKYKDYPELSAIFVAIDDCYLNLERMEVSPKPEEPPHASEPQGPYPPVYVEEEGGEPQIPDESADKPGLLSDGLERPESRGQAVTPGTSGRVGADFKMCGDCRKFKPSSKEPGKGNCEKYPKPLPAGNLVLCPDYEAKDSADINDPSPEVPAQMEVGQVENAVG